MTIELKLGVNDTCYFIEDNKIKKGTIEKIEVIINRGGRYDFNSEIFISYYVSKDNSTCVLYNNDIFKTLEETLKYLEENVE